MKSQPAIEDRTDRLPVFSSHFLSHLELRFHISKEVTNNQPSERPPFIKLVQSCVFNDFVAGVNALFPILFLELKVPLECCGAGV